MPIGTTSNMKIYDPRTQGAYREMVDQRTELFNAASRGAITLSTATKAGDFDFEAFFAKNVGSAVTRRDPTSVAAVTDTLIGQSEFVSVKCNRRIGPHALTLDSLRKAGINTADDNAVAFALGEWAAMDATQERLNTAIGAVVGGIRTQTALVHDISALTGGNQFLSANAFVQAVQKFGDMASQIAVWVTHSAPVTQLTLGQIATNATGIASVVATGGDPLTLGRPMLVTDSASLVDSTDYYVVGLVPGAVEVEDTEEETIVSEIVTGLENLVNRLQGEYAFNLGLKGMAWNTASGANPTAAAVATPANWTKVVNSNKYLPGVIIKCKAA